MKKLRIVVVMIVALVFMGCVETKPVPQTPDTKGNSRARFVEVKARDGGDYIMNTDRISVVHKKGDQCIIYFSDSVGRMGIGDCGKFVEYLKTPDVN